MQKRKLLFLEDSEDQNFNTPSSQQEKQQIFQVPINFQKEKFHAQGMIEGITNNENEDSEDSDELQSSRGHKKNQIKVNNPKNKKKGRDLNKVIKIEEENDIKGDQKEDLFEKINNNTQTRNFETILLSDVHEIHKKLKQEERDEIGNEIPPFIPINGDKTKINEKRFIFRGMLAPCDRKQAKKDFLKYAYPYRDILYKIFKAQYLQKRDSHQCFKWYTKQSFVYKCVNKGLRVLQSAVQLFYLRFIFSDIFISIWQRYRQIEKNEEFTCYRGSFLYPKYYSQFKNRVGQYIEMQGFLSTSLKKEVAYSHYNNVLFQIKVNKAKHGKKDFGYAYLEKYTDFPGQMEYLFNAINIFKIVSVQQGQFNIIKLEYVRIQDIKNKQDKTISQQQLIENYEFQQKIFGKIADQGRTMLQCGQLQNAVKWYQLRIKKVQQSHLKQKDKAPFIDTQLVSKTFNFPIYEEYAYLVFMIAVCYNNKQDHKNALKQMKKCVHFYEQVMEVQQRINNFKQSFQQNRKQNEKCLHHYCQALKELGKMYTNCDSVKTTLNEKFLQKAVEKKRSLHKNESQNGISYYKFQKQVIKILKNKSISLKQMEKELDQCESQRGRNNIFYLCKLMSKVQRLFINNKDIQIVNYFEAKYKSYQQLLSFLSINREVCFILATSYLSKKDKGKGKEIFEIFMKDILKGPIEIKSIQMIGEFMNKLYSINHKEITFIEKYLIQILNFQIISPTFYFSQCERILVLKDFIQILDHVEEKRLKLKFKQRILSSNLCNSKLIKKMKIHR